MVINRRPPALGKPAEYGQEILKRRYRLTTSRLKLKDALVVDFGCGNGAQTAEFLHSGCKIIAVDVNHQQQELFVEYLLRQRLQSHLLVAQYDGGSLPIKSESVDIVSSYDVLEHVVSESQALQEMHRVLKPGAELVMTVPNKGWIFETHGARLPFLPWNRVPFFSWLPRGLHDRFANARIYKKRDVIRLLSENSFRVLEVVYLTAPMDVVKNHKLKKFLRSSIFRNDTTKWAFLATSIFVHCRKS